MIRKDTILVSVCAVDSELGIIQNVEEIGRLLKNYPNTYFHVDASQSFGKINIDFTNIDLVTIAPHKFYGLNSSGILIKKKNVSLKPQIVGGKSTTIFRSGTPDLSMIKSIDKAISLILKIDNSKVKKLSDKLKMSLSEFKGITINSIDSIPHIVNFSIKGNRGIDIQKMFEDNDIYVSFKTSCCPVETPSKLVYALTKDKSLALSSIRVSISHLTKDEEIDIFLRVLKEFLDGKVSGN